MSAVSILGSSSKLDALKKLTQIGIALSAEKNIDRLFRMILEFAMDFTRADGGTLYIVSDDKKTLNFALIRNRTLGIEWGIGASPVKWPPVALFDEKGTPNLSNVSSYCAITGKVLNIPDVYRSTEFNFDGTKAFDSKTGYRSKSMLVVPMKNHENEIIGVLQLINAMDRKKTKVKRFSFSSQEMAESLASLASVALTNRMLISELELLLQSSISLISSAIDERSPYTSGHSRRVTELSVEIAKKINEAKSGPFANIFFSEDEIKEIEIASLLHDLGKLSVPEKILDKATKLQCIFDKIDLIKMRYEILKKEAGAKSTEERKKLDEEIEFLESVNRGNYPLTDEMIERLKRISKKTVRVDGGAIPLITKDELESLIVRAGTLTEEERKKVMSHAEVTYRMLCQLPFPKKLKEVPLIAGAHHEKLDGSGYPKKLKAENIPLKARILAIADIFEALTARDRPYMKAKKLSEVLKIMEDMAKKGEIDKDLFELFVKSGIVLAYAKKEMLPEQIDIC